MRPPRTASGPARAPIRDDRIGSAFDRGGNRSRAAPRGERDARLLRESFDRSSEAFVGKDRRDRSVRERPQVVHRSPQLSVRAGRACVRVFGVGREPRAQEPQREREPDEALLCAVVEVALEPAALGVACLDDTGAEARRSSSWARTSAWSRSFSSTSRAAAATSLGELGIVEQPGAVGDHGHHPAVADERRRASAASPRRRRACRARRRGGRRRPGSRPSSSGIAERAGERVAQPARGRATCRARRRVARATRACGAPAAQPQATASGKRARAPAWASQSRRSSSPLPRKPAVEARGEVRPRQGRGRRCRRVRRGRRPGVAAGLERASLQPETASRSSDQASPSVHTGAVEPPRRRGRRREQEIVRAVSATLARRVEEERREEAKHHHRADEGHCDGGALPHDASRPLG